MVEDLSFFCVICVVDGNGNYFLEVVIFILFIVIYIGGLDLMFIFNFDGSLVIVQSFFSFFYTYRVGNRIMFIIVYNDVDNKIIYVLIVV